jgi:hypothetical protein
MCDVDAEVNRESKLKCVVEVPQPPTLNRPVGNHANLEATT